MPDVKPDPRPPLTDLGPLAGDGPEFTLIWDMIRYLYRC